VHSLQKIFEVFCVKECILLHFLQRNSELLVSNTYASAVPGTKTVLPRGRQEHEQWQGLTTPVGGISRPPR